MKKSWSLESMHDLMLYHLPPDDLLKDLRLSIMLYISKALYFDFCIDEKEFIHRLDKNRDVRDNVTPNGGVVPKKEYQLEYNMVLRSWSKVMQNMTNADSSLLNKFRMTPNIRIKFGRELQDNISRPLSTSHAHSDAWVEGPWAMNCFVPLLGDVEKNNLTFWKPKNIKEYTDEYLNVAATYEEMHWVLDHYQKDENLKPKKGCVHISDYALIHATDRKNECGTRISIDTTIVIGNHPVHPDREVEYLDKLKIIGEEAFISTNRSIDDKIIKQKNSIFSHYSSGNLTVLDLS
jgi:hypothetical protein